MSAEGSFDDAFREQFRQLLRWRRDVRRFSAAPLAAGLLDELLALTRYAPSVGLSEPWRFLSVEHPKRRAAIRADFEQANAVALAGYSGERAALYSRLKLAGLDSAPVHLAVFCEAATEQGAGLGRQTMPEAMEYSTVAAIITLWLAARAHGVGLGWISILHPERVAAILSAPAEWRLIAYLCLGYPLNESLTPELEDVGWEQRRPSVPLLKR